MAKETYYRFELAFSGEEQDVGLLQGLADTSLSPSVIEELYHSFDLLPLPPILETPDDSAVVFLFTEKGVREFANAINNIIFELRSYDWQVIAMPFQLEPKFALFCDEYQIAYSRTDLLELMWPEHFNFCEVSSVSSSQSNPLIKFVEEKHPSLDVIVKEASAKQILKKPQNSSKSYDLVFPIK